MSDVRNQQQFGYHAAPDWARSSIERHGLQPHLGQPLWEETEDHHGDEGGGYGRGVYLFKDPAEAHSYAAGMERMSRQKLATDDNLRLREPTNFDVWQANVTEHLERGGVEEDPDFETYKSHVALHDIKRIPRP